MNLTVTIALELRDDSSDDDIIELLGAIAAQVEDDVPGIVLRSTIDAPHPAWQPVTRVDTYADGFGNWHALVQGTADVDAAARLARDAIVAELTCREAPGWDPRTVRIQREDDGDVVGAFTFGEVPLT